MDKREVASVFRIRLQSLIDRRNETVSAFSRRCGLDRSALSQFLDDSCVRLPRAETLVTISTSESVSTDWLLGISQDEESLGEVASMLSIETASYGQDDPPLENWHREAAGYKIRYAPSSLPDLLRTKALIDHEFGAKQKQYADVKTDISQRQLDYSRLPETDMEVILPFQRFQNLALGVDTWGGLSPEVRQDQLNHAARLLEELYPTFRMFLYDGLIHYSAPYTVFGPKRAAVYLGDMYLVINSVEHIRELTKRFDNMIRVCEISPDRAAQWVSSLKVG